MLKRIKKSKEKPKEKTEKIVVYKNGKIYEVKDFKKAISILYSKDKNL